jgi:hypothetical protein
MRTEVNQTRPLGRTNPEIGAGRSANVDGHGI